MKQDRKMECAIHAAETTTIGLNKLVEFFKKPTEATLKEAEFQLSIAVDLLKSATATAPAAANAAGE